MSRPDVPPVSMTKPTAQYPPVQGQDAGRYPTVGYPVVSTGPGHVGDAYPTGAFPGRAYPGAGPAPVPYPAGMPVYGTQVTVAPAPSNVEIIIAWVLTVITVLYFLPWAIAATRRTTNSVLIGVLTFLLGWTVIGWLVCLVLACVTGAPHRVTVTTVVAAPPPPVAAGRWATCAGDPPGVLRWWDGQAWTGHTTVG